jgi:predicted Fe-Mo cluster-binding NifX family protein
LKIAVSATNDSLGAQIDPRFGRCPYFLIVDSETMTFEAIPNTASGAMSGAGIQAAQVIATRGVQAVLTGNVGPNAFQALSSAGIDIITGAFGTVREAVEKFKSGQLQKITAPTTSMGFGMGGGYGMGMGMGRGRGGGRGMGFRRWQSTGPFPQAPTTTPAMPPVLPQMSKEQEIQMLENQMKDVQKQLDQIRKRLKELKK